MDRYSINLGKKPPEKSKLEKSLIESEGIKFPFPKDEYYVQFHKIIGDETIDRGDFVLRDSTVYMQPNISGATGMGPMSGNVTMMDGRLCWIGPIIKDKFSHEK
jgi:hypothetical protein